MAGFEVAPSTGTPHLQGYVEFGRRVRPTELREFKEWRMLHWGDKRGRPCRKGDKSRMTCIEYCLKDGKPWKHWGLPTPRAKMTLADIDNNPKGHGPQMRAIIDLFKERTREDRLFGRTIHWRWEPHGFWGKNAVIQYLIDNREALMVSGKAADMKYAVQQWIMQKGEGPEIIIVNIVKDTKLEFVSFPGIEEIKDGCFFSGKYEGGMVRYDRPHMIVFANEEPDLSRMSADRWDVVELVHEDT